MRAKRLILFLVWGILGCKTGTLQSTSIKPLESAKPASTESKSPVSQNSTTPESTATPVTSLSQSAACMPLFTTSISSDHPAFLSLYTIDQNQCFQISDVTAFGYRFEYNQTENAKPVKDFYFTNFNSSPGFSLILDKCKLPNEFVSGEYTLYGEAVLKDKSIIKSNRLKVLIHILSPEICQKSGGGASVSRIEN